MKINSLLESQTPSSAISNTTSSAPVFGRDDEHLDETTTSGSVATLASPVGGMQRRGKGSMLKGIKTSAKFPNSQAVKEEQLDEVNPHNYDSDEDYYNALKAPAKPRYRGTQSPGVNPDDEAYFREIWRKNRLAKQQQERDADHDRLATGTNEGQEVDASVVIGKLHDIIDHAENAIKNADYDHQVQYLTVVRDRAVKALNMIKTNPRAAVAAWKYFQNGEQGVAEGSLEEVDRRGFLKGLGAAAVAGGVGYAANDMINSVREGKKRFLKIQRGDSEGAVLHKMGYDELGLGPKKEKGSTGPWGTSETWTYNGVGSIKFNNGKVDIINYVSAPLNKYESVEQSVAEDQLDEKSKSQAQFRTMAAVAHNPKFAKKVGISQKVGKEFHNADKKSDYEDLPARADEEKQRLDPKCWTGYKKQGTKMKGDTRVNNCVPIEEAELNEEDMLAKELFKQLDLFKKGIDKDIGSKAKDRELGNRPADKDIVVKDTSGEYDDEAGSAESNLLTTARAVKGLLDTIKDKDNLPEWVQEKIAKAEGMLVTAWDYLQSQKEQGIDPQVDEDWQKANKSDKTDGMSTKAVKAYRRENPGSKLKTAVTKEPSKIKKGSSDDKRRKSFCARSNGQRKMHNIDCSKTPDKAICKARKRWNC